MSAHPHPGKRSDWFPALMIPSRIGWYEIKVNTRGIQQRFFDGLEWRLSPGGTVSFFGISRYDKWRGLAEKPE